MEQQKQDPREYWHNFPEAPFSDTFKYVDVNGFEHLVTVRGWTFGALAEAIKKACAAITEEGGKPFGKQAQPQAQQPAQPSSSKYNDGDGTYESPKSFEAGKVIVSITDGKQYFKVTGTDGAKFPKFPVTIWPETLEKAGIDQHSIDFKDGLSLAGYKALYIVNEKGNPAKVISLIHQSAEEAFK